ncbi:MAG: hypothetical protein EOO38_03290 [Cytophagaceae bacterium]|nr:MAG: hypothetical protein EOO38_03290 [Cytophagaceae bacterium]
MAKLCGKWLLQAITHDATWQQRIVISGSVAHDGPHVLALGVSLPHVDGKSLEIVAQAFNPTTKTWVNSLMKEELNWDNVKGLQMRLSVDDNPPHGDLDFNDLVVLCTSEDKDLVSPLAGTRPDLTIPKKYYKSHR